MPPDRKMLTAELGAVEAFRKLVGAAMPCVRKGADTLAYNEPSGLEACLTNATHTGALDKYDATIAPQAGTTPLPSCLEPQALRSEVTAFVFEDISPVVLSTPYFLNSLWLGVRLFLWSKKH